MDNRKHNATDKTHIVMNGQPGHDLVVFPNFHSSAHSAQIGGEIAVRDGRAFRKAGAAGSKLNVCEVFRLRFVKRRGFAGYRII